MSDEEIQDLINEIRFETEFEGITPESLAFVLSKINSAKATKQELAEVFEQSVLGLTKKTTDVQYGDKIIKKFLGYYNPDGTLNDMDSQYTSNATNGDWYIAAAGGYTDDPDEALDYAPEPGQPGADGNQFYSLSEMPNLAYGNWGDVVQFDNKIYKKIQTKKIRFVKIETGGAANNDGILFSWLKIFDKNGNQIFDENTSTVTTSHPITEGYIANLYDDSSSYVYIGNVTSYNDIRWLQVDLGELNDVAKIEEALYPGAQNHHDKKVMVSADGVDWEILFDSNKDGEYTESITPPATRSLSGWQFQFNINTPPKTVSDELSGASWNLDLEPKKTATLSQNKEINVIFSAGSEGDLTVDGKGFSLNINGQSFVTNSEYKTHFRLLEMGGELVIIPSVLKAASESPYKELTAKYVENSGSSQQEAEALQIFTSRIRNFYEKILAFYPHTGNSLENKTFNLMRPYAGRENFQQKHIGTVVDDVKGIKLTAGSANRILSGLEPMCLSDANNYGFFLHKKQLIHYANWIVGTVDELGNIHNHFGSYHAGAGGTLQDYIQIMGDSILIPELNNTGLLSIRCSEDDKIKIYNMGTNSVHNATIYDDAGLATGGGHMYYDYPQLALIGQGGDAVYSCWGVYQSLTDAEHTLLMNAINEFLTATNRN